MRIVLFSDQVKQKKKSSFPQERISIEVLINDSPATPGMCNTRVGQGIKKYFEEPTNPHLVSSDPTARLEIKPSRLAELFASQKHADPLVQS